MRDFTNFHKAKEQLGLDISFVWLGKDNFIYVEGSAEKKIEIPNGSIKSIKTILCERFLKEGANE